MRMFLFSIALIFIPFYSLCQTTYGARGISLYGSTNNFVGINGFSSDKHNLLSWGLNIQLNGQKIETKKKRNENDGRIEARKGDFIWSTDLGYGRIFHDRWTLQGQLSLGGKKYFTNFEDEEDSSKDYSLITSSKFVIGAGLQLGYRFKIGLEPFLGIHSLRQIDIGLKIF